MEYQDSQAKDDAFAPYHINHVCSSCVAHAGPGVLDGTLSVIILQICLDQRLPLVCIELGRVSDSFACGSHLSI